MFRPDSNRDRTDYGGILMPPDGYRLDRAVGTTYSLDLEALTAVAICLGLSEETDSKLMQNPIGISCRGLWMLTESCGRSITGNHSGRDKQVPAVKDCRFTQTAFGTVVHDSSGKWLGQYETEDAAVEMLREMAKDTGGYSDEI